MEEEIIKGKINDEIYKVKLYKGKNIIDTFFEDYGKPNKTQKGITYSISEVSFIEARDLYNHLKSDINYALEYEKNKKRLSKLSKESLQNQIYLAYKLGHTETQDLLKEVFETIDEYVDNTYNAMINEGYKYTLEQLADILSCSVAHITRNFMKYFDYIELPNFVRFIIKKEVERNAERATNLPFRDVLFLRKNIFISEESVIRFLIHHLRYNEIRIRKVIDTDSDIIGFMEGKTNFKGLVKKFIYENERKVIGIPKGLEVSKTQKKSQVYTYFMYIDKEEAMKILNGEIILDTSESLKAMLQEQKMAELDVANRDYKHVTIANVQFFNYLFIESYKRYQIVTEDGPSDGFIRYWMFDTCSEPLQKGELAFSLDFRYLNKIIEEQNVTKDKDFILHKNILTNYITNGALELYLKLNKDKKMEDYEQYMKEQEELCQKKDKKRR